MHRLEQELKDEDKCERLAAELRTFPGITEEQVLMTLSAYEDRVERKKLLRQWGLSNAAAEVRLDLEGFPRPPGWHSVFFYPDSYRPRGTVICTFLLIGWLGWWIY
jgi:hypothetical protein